LPHRDAPTVQAPNSPVVEAALALFEATNRADREAVLALMAEDVEIFSAAPQAAGVSRIDSGHEGLRRWWHQLDADEITVSVIVLDSVELGGHALSNITVTHRRAGGAPHLATTLWSVIALDGDGKIASTWSYRQEIEARAAIRSGRAL
jgi:ketosteroid isomerase-like protein